MFICLQRVSIDMSDLSVLGVLGLPGAGKTTAAEALSANRESVEMLTMSSVAGEVFDAVYEDGVGAFPVEMQEQIEDAEVSSSEVVPSEDTSKALATFADTVLGIDGTFFSRRAVASVESNGVENVVVDGVRSMADATGFEEAAESFELVYIHTPFSVRLERLTSRGRDSEQDADSEYLVERDDQELGWGVDNILTAYQPQMFYNNYPTEQSYTDSFVEFVDTRLSF